MSPERVVMQVVEEAGEIIETPLSAEDLQLDWKKGICPYCGVGCGLLVGNKDGRVMKTRGDPGHPANWGLICGKGATLPQMVNTPDRMTHPLMRTNRQQDFQRATWEQAFDHVASRWRAIIERHGPQAVAFYISGQLFSEDYYVVNKLMKGFIGSNNVDSNSRLCMASAVTGYTRSLGADAPPGCYADIELADCFLLIGTNAAACHPVTFERIRRRRSQAGGRISLIVVDPRKTATGEAADLYIPVRPGTDIALLNAMLHVIAREGLLDETFIQKSTAGWESLRTLIREYPPERAAGICGIDAKLIVEAALRFGRAKAAMSFWTMGLNQSTQGTANNNCVINLHLATGQIGRAGCGPFSLTGQPNAMGGRETGGLAGLLPGHRAVTNASDRQEMENLWGVQPGSIAEKPGQSAVELFQALAEGTVKSVWILATNPMVSMPNLALARKALQAAELVVVNDIYYPTETGQYADIVFPAAQWVERDGTMTNSERAVSYSEQTVEPPGEALADWRIICRFARALGFADAFGYSCAEEIFEEYKQSTAGRDMDMTGMSYARLRQGPIQWPCPTSNHRSTMRRYTKKIFAHPDGKARFLAHHSAGPAEPTDASFPMILTTGRVRDQWHTMTRTGKIPVFSKREPEPFLELHPDDAAGLNIRSGQRVSVISRRGRASAKCRLTPSIRAGTCFMPFHWGSLWTQEAPVNQATQEAFDPISKQPELKFCAVRLEAENTEMEP